MIITRLEEIDKSKVKVYIDDEYAFLLYQKDLRRFCIDEGNEITVTLYHDLMEDVIFRRAKQKALALLKFMDRSEAELRKKLEDAFYPSQIIERTIAYVYEYGYINDERYTSIYIRNRKHTKSKRIIKSELLTKGINKEIIDNIMMEEYQSETEDPEETAIKKAIYKKKKAPEELEYEEKQKLIASLYRKGFDIEKIRRVLSV
ncbi:RecX family transcriptional regulator [Mobilitalea sibirica]|uniref:Regulatory protein RecX n=1 Tax=Mobilitalea sibirica TaxID=1462919 RepID=A0A8J7HC39_9FIRM|nr:RecX family transcriptional regulator [Mobilitalea sibirica]MBH1942391.1 RecX family transcriptional regulator [Mobilitalea sibirica]